MQGRFRVGRKTVAKMTLRLEATDPDGLEVTDIMLQPGGSVSGWLPHVTELPWAAGIVEGGEVDEITLQRIQDLESLAASQAALLASLGVKVDELEESGGIDQNAVYQAYVETRGNG